MTTTPMPPVTDLMPHRGRALLLERVLEHDGTSTTARVVVGSSEWLRRVDGSVPAWLAIEYMAQCLAAHEGLLALAEGRPLPRGSLIKAAGVRLGCPQLDSGQVLRVRTVLVRGRPGLGVLSHQCTVHPEHEPDTAPPIAEGRLSVSVERDPSARRRRGGDSRREATAKETAR